MKDFILLFADIKEQKLNKAIEAIKSVKRKPLSELKVFDLLLTPDGTEQIRHGVYLFWNAKGQVVYVGKNSSYHFVQRIPNHLGLSKNFFDNHLLKRIIKFELKIDYSYSSFVSAAMYAQNFEISLIPINIGTPDTTEQEGKQITKFEKLLRVKLEPKYNSYKSQYPKEYNRCTKKLADGNLKLDEAIAKM